MATLVIDNVDLKELNMQRYHLARVVLSKSFVLMLDKDQQDALLALLNMLDAWSDKLYLEEVNHA